MFSAQNFILNSNVNNLRVQTAFDRRKQYDIWYPNTQNTWLRPC